MQVVHLDLPVGKDVISGSGLHLGFPNRNRKFHPHRHWVTNALPNYLRSMKMCPNNILCHLLRSLPVVLLCLFYRYNLYARSIYISVFMWYFLPEPTPPRRCQPGKDVWNSWKGKCIHFKSLLLSYTPYTRCYIGICMCVRVRFLVSSSIIAHCRDEMTKVFECRNVVLGYLFSIYIFVIYRSTVYNHTTQT